VKLFGHHVHLPILLLALAELGVSAAAFVGVSYWVGNEASGLRLVLRLVVFGGAVVLANTAMGLYQARQRLKIEGVVVRLAVALAGALAALALIDFILPFGVDPRLWMYSFGASLVLLTVGRIILWRLVDHDAFQRRILVYGAGSRASTLLQLRRRSDQRGFRIVAFVPAASDKYVIDDSRVERLREGESLLEFAQRKDIEEIVVAMDDRRAGFPVAELLQCKFAGIDVVDIVGFLERETGKLWVDLMNPGWLIFSEGLSANLGRSTASRALDLIGSAVLLTVCLPIMLLTAIAIPLESGWPILYRQQRVGLAGRTFTLYKFRSMVQDAEADGKPRWATLGDERVTRVGRILRKMRIDELPQLFNVLRGDMSLVGPRPERPEFVERLSQSIPYYHERHCVKPGVTGWAQLCHPYGSSEKDALEKLQYDLYYVKHRNLLFDLGVLLQTAEVIFWGKGAR
jgi:sugar transferase (PEP-CTERM system associated)